MAGRLSRESGPAIDLEPAGIDLPFISMTDAAARARQRLNINIRLLMLISNWTLETWRVDRAQLFRSFTSTTGRKTTSS
jgi:hypothetical protein